MSIETAEVCRLTIGRRGYLVYSQHSPLIYFDKYDGDFRGYMSMPIQAAAFVRYFALHFVISSLMFHYHAIYHCLENMK